MSGIMVFRRVLPRWNASARVDEFRGGRRSGEDSFVDIAALQPMKLHGPGPGQLAEIG